MLRSGDWLTDRHIDAVNQLISAEIGTYANQTTLLVQTAKGFTQIETESVNILHDCNHWITTACLGSEVVYADSLGRDISKVVAAQMLQLYASKCESDSSLKVSQLRCDQQRNASNCGLFAAAFAFDLVHGGVEALHRTYVVRSMRPHLEHCLITGTTQPFPGRPVKAGRKTHRNVFTLRG
jgi:hypothetical protein